MEAAFRAVVVERRGTLMLTKPCEIVLSTNRAARRLRVVFIVELVPWLF